MKETVEEKKIKQFTLTNKNGMSVSFLNYGCIITEILVPDRSGKIENVVMGFENAEDYKKNPWYLGAAIGRFAGRIGGGAFKLNGQTYQLEKNDGENHLHGGQAGFDKVFWQDEQIAGGIRFYHESSDGEGGYPGTIQVITTYTLNDDNEFSIRYEAVSDQETLLNMTNHTYFNLSGNLNRDTADHFLKISSSRYAKLNDQLLPTGELADVGGTAFDFRRGQKIKAGIESIDLQNKIAGEGYDHPFELEKNKEIFLVDEESGRKLEIKTDQECVVFYSGTQITEGIKLNGAYSRKYLGLCLETQGFPDSIHHANFPQSVLKAGQAYTASTIYRFSAE